MSEYDPTQIDPAGGSPEASEASSNIFLDMTEKDTTGIPSLAHAPDSVISSSSDSKTNTQVLITACVLAVGIGAIYGMRYIGMKAGLDENIVSIEYAADENSADFSKRFQSVMRTLDKSTVSVQISDTDSFATHPFSRPDTMSEEVVAIEPGMSEEERMALQRERDRERAIGLRREQVLDEAMSFRLQSIIGGSRPAARISGKPVRAGMSLGEYFEVIEITGNSVVIEGDGMKFVLSMREETTQLN